MDGESARVSVPKRWASPVNPDDGSVSVPAPATVPMAERIFAEQVRLLYRSAVPLAVNVINMAIMAGALWFRLPDSAIAGWLTVMTIALVFRLWLRHSFRRNRAAMPDRGWAVQYAVGTGITGALWGLTAFVVPMIDEPAYHMLVGLAVAGMSAGAVASLSVHLPAFYAFVLPAIVPLAGVFLAAGDLPHQGLGLMMIVFTTAIVLIARTFNSAMRETLRLRFQNADLAHELSVARDMAEQASRSNWDTLAHLSHEMRTPLNAIGGFAEIMRRRLFGSLGHGKYEEYARDIADSTTHLTSLVEEILLYSRGQIGGLRLDESVIDAGAEIESCLQMVREAAREAGLNLSADIDSDLPSLLADPVKLRQILLNLLSNAIKFTPQGGSITLKAFVDGAHAVVITVSDTGIGIDAADLHRVMQPYVQLESAFRRRRHSGLGLGLPIVKRLVELHNGHFALQSEPGIGTTVTVRFPPDRSVLGDLAVSAKPRE